MILLNDVEEQVRINKEAVGSNPPLKEPNNFATVFSRRLFALIALIVIVGIIYSGAYMVRYEVIVVPKADESMMTIVEYIVKDRWTGDIEVVWQLPNGQVRQSKYHPFDGSRS